MTTGPQDQSDEVKSGSFEAVGISAAEAARDPAISTPAPESGGIQPMSASEQYNQEILKNLSAHRLLRVYAFVVAGLIALAFFVLLWCALRQIFFDGYLAGILGASTQPDSWHSLVLIGVSLALLATIPLSLCLALVRMVSDKDPGDESSVKMATTELGKVLYDLIKGFVAQGRGG